MARNLQANPEPHGEREVLHSVEARLDIVEEPEPELVLRRLLDFFFLAQFLLGFRSLHLVYLEDGLVEVEGLAYERLEYGNVGHA